MNVPPQVVFDTNILFSAIGWLGNPHRCVQAARRGECVSLTCEPILAELAEKLQLKRGFDGARAAETINEIRTFSKVIAVPGTLKVITADPDDDAILECAVTGRGQYLVSGGRHLLALGNYQGIQILKAAELLSILHGTPKV